MNSGEWDHPFTCGGGWKYGTKIPSGHNVNFLFGRDVDLANLILYKYGAEPNPEEFDFGGL